MVGSNVLSAQFSDLMAHFYKKKNLFRFFIYIQYPYHIFAIFRATETLKFTPPHLAIFTALLLRQIWFWTAH